MFKSPSFERGAEQYGVSDELFAANEDCVPAVKVALLNVGAAVRWPMYDREPIARWSTGRQLLIGDAAHPMLQYLAGCRAAH